MSAGRPIHGHSISRHRLDFPSHITLGVKSRVGITQRLGNIRTTFVKCRDAGKTDELRAMNFDEPAATRRGRPRGGAAAPDGAPSPGSSPDGAFGTRTVARLGCPAALSYVVPLSGRVLRRPPNPRCEIKDADEADEKRCSWPGGGRSAHRPMVGPRRLRPSPTVPRSAKAVAQPWARRFRGSPDGGTSAIYWALTCRADGSTRSVVGRSAPMPRVARPISVTKVPNTGLAGKSASRAVTMPRTTVGRTRARMRPP